MRKQFAFAIVLLLLALPAMASDPQFTGWIYNGQGVTIDDVFYRVIVASGGNRVIVSFDDQSADINSGECSTVENRRICFNSSSYDSQVEDYKSYLNIFYVRPVIEIDRTVENNILTVGETATFHVEVTNSGDADGDIVFAEELPPQVKIDSVDTCSIEGQDVVWRGKLKKGESFTCDYDIIPMDTTDNYLKASASYNDGFADKEVFSTSVHLYATSIFVSKLGLNATKLGLKQEGRLNVNFTNNGADDAIVKSVRLRVPKAIVVVDTNLAQDGGIYTWSGDVSAGEKKSFFLDFYPTYTGPYVFTAETIYAYGEFDDRTTDTSVELDVENTTTEFTSYMIDGASYDAGEQIHFTLGIRNPFQHSKIRSIRSKGYSTVTFIPDGFVDEIAANRSDRLVDITFSAPDVDTTTVYNININVTYESEFGESFSQAFSRRFTVVPIQKIEITKSVSPNEAHEGEPINVVVTVANGRNVDIDSLYVSESLPSGLSVKGQTSNYISLARGETKQAYSYTITAPIISGNHTRYSMNTTAAYSMDGREFAFYSNSTFTVEPKRPSIEITKTIVPDEPFVGDPVTVTYVIHNGDTEPALDIVLYFTQQGGIELQNAFNYTLKKLDPGEQITVSPEKFRPLVSGHQALDGSMVYYHDRDGRQFNTTSSSQYVTIKAKMEPLEGPALLINKTTDAVAPMAGDNITVILIVYNPGSEDADITLSDGDESWNRVIPAGRTRNITHVVSYSEAGDYMMGRAKAYYKSGEDTMLVFSGSPSIHIKEQPKADAPAEGSGTGEAPGTGEEIAVKKKGIFERFFDWLKSLFSKKK